MKVPLLLAGLFIAGAAPQPPTIVHGAGPFTATRVPERPAIDGRHWIGAEARPVFENGSFKLKSLPFTATDCGDVGDFTRCHLLLGRGGGPPIRIDIEFTGWVFVTPDERYVITEPLDVLDRHSWKQYVLSEGLGIQNYTSIDAISGDGKQLFVSRRDCPYDCRGRQTFEYYLVRLP